MSDEYAMMEIPMAMYVLLVANCSISQDQLMDYLQRCRCEVRVENNTSKALESVTEHKEMYDILIVNIDTRRMKKFEYLELAQIVKTLPIIVLSRSHDGNMIMKAYAKEASNCSFKPIQLDHFKNIMSFVNEQNRNNIAQENNTYLDPNDHNCEGPINEVSNGKADRICDELNQGKNIEQDNNKEDATSVSKKKSRLIWTEELNSKFKYAVNKFGVHNVRPKQILEIMNVSYLTRDHVASHLQKYRHYLKRVNKKKMNRKARTSTLINSMMLVEPRIGFGHLIKPNDSLEPTQLERQGLLVKPKADINMSQGGISSNINGDHFVYLQPNGAYLPQVPRSGFTYDLRGKDASLLSLKRDLSMSKETNINASFGDRVLPSQEELTEIIEPRNDIMISSDSGVDPSLQQLTGCNEMPSTGLPTFPFMAKSGFKQPFKPQSQCRDVPVKVKSFQQVSQSSSEHFYECATNHLFLEPRLQHEDAPLNAAQSQYQAFSINSYPFIGDPSQQDDHLNKVMSNALTRPFEDPLNNGLLEPQLQYQDSLLHTPPLIEVPPQLDSRNHLTKNAREPDDSSLDESFSLPSFEGFGEDKFAEETLKVMREMGIMTQEEQINIQSVDFD